MLLPVGGQQDHVSGFFWLLERGAEGKIDFESFISSVVWGTVIYPVRFLR